MIVHAPAVVGVAVHPATVSLAKGATEVRTVTATDARGKRLQGRRAERVSRSPEVVRVGNDGTLRANRAGSIFVFASMEDRSDSAQVTVQAVPIHGVAVAAKRRQLSPGRSHQYVAFAFDADGKPLPGALVALTAGSALVLGFRSRDVERTITFVDPFNNPREYVRLESERPHVGVGIAAALAVTTLGAVEAYLHARGARDGAPPRISVRERVVRPILSSEAQALRVGVSLSRR